MNRLNGVLLGGMWLVSLGACQRENAAVVEAAAPPAAVAADTSAPDPASSALRRDWHHLSRPTSRRAPLIRYTALRRPAALAAALAPPPTEAHLLDFTLKASEFFRIDPTHPAEVRGREGTVLRLPAHALVDAQQRPVQEPVWLELKECYSLADMLLSDCVSTNAAGQPMQAAGMLLVRASTGHGQRLQLAAGQQLDISLPAEQASAGRQLYYSATARRDWTALPVDNAADSGPAYALNGSTLTDAAAESSATTSSNLLSSAGDVPAAPNLRSSALGWLTCLRSWQSAGDIGLLVPADVDDHTTVRLVFPQAGVILAGTPHADGYAFTGLPAQQRAVLVALRYEGDSTYLALQRVTAGSGAEPLQFRYMPIGDIEQQLENLH